MKNISNRRSKPLLAYNEEGHEDYLVIDPDGRLQVEVNAKVDAHGNIITTPIKSIFNGLFLYDSINDQEFRIVTSGSGTITSNNSAAELTSGSQTFSIAALQTKSILQYISGMKNILRFGHLFGTPTISSEQRAGLGITTNEVSFGYSGIQFGIFEGHTGEHEEVELTVNVGGTPQVLIVELGGVNYSITLTNSGGDLEFTAHEICTRLMEDSGFMSIWTCANIENKVVFTSVRAISITNSYSCALGTFTSIKTGTPTIYEFTPESEFNENSELSLSIDKQSGNHYEISYYFGFGEISFSILDPLTKTMKCVHRLFLGDSFPDLLLTIPHMPFQTIVANFFNTDPITMKTTSIGLFNSGISPILNAPFYAHSVTQTISSGFEQPVLALRVKFSVNGIIMRSRIILKRITFASEASKNTIFNIYLNPTLGSVTTSDYPIWQNTYPAILHEESSVSFTGGTKIDSIIVSPGLSDAREFQDEGLVLIRDDILLITAEYASGSSADISLSLSWLFDI